MVQDNRFGRGLCLEDELILGFVIKNLKEALYILSIDPENKQTPPKPLSLCYLWKCAPNIACVVGQGIQFVSPRASAASEAVRGVPRGMEIMRVEHQVSCLIFSV